MAGRDRFRRALAAGLLLTFLGCSAAWAVSYARLLYVCLELPGRALVVGCTDGSLYVYHWSPRPCTRMRVRTMIAKPWRVRNVAEELAAARAGTPRQLWGFALEWGPRDLVSSMQIAIVPLWFLALITGPYALVLLARAATRRKSIRLGEDPCPGCGYDRRGLAPKAPCPECGGSAALQSPDAAARPGG